MSKKNKRRPSDHLQASSVSTAGTVLPEPEAACPRPPSEVGGHATDVAPGVWGISGEHYACDKCEGNVSVGQPIFVWHGDDLRLRSIRGNAWCAECALSDADAEPVIRGRIPATVARVIEAS